MTSIWGPNINYTPDYWPFWLIIIAVIALITVIAIAIHAFLRINAAKKTAEGDPEKEYLYIKPIRAWHWLNALAFITLLVTGLMNHFTLGPTKTLVKVHFVAAMVFILLWVSFVIINTVTGNNRNYRIKFSGLLDRMFKQAWYYLSGIMKNEPHPFETSAENKFNPLQQLTYFAIVYICMPLIIITGLFALYPTITGQGHWMLEIHLAFGALALIFLIGHLYLATTGDRPSYLVKGMIDGYHRHDKK